MITKNRRQSSNIKDKRGKQDRPTKSKAISDKVNRAKAAYEYPRDATPEMRAKAKALGLSSSLSKLDEAERKSEARRRTRMERIPRG